MVSQNLWMPATSSSLFIGSSDSTNTYSENIAVRFRAVTDQKKCAPLPVCIWRAVGDPTRSFEVFRNDFTAAETVHRIPQTDIRSARRSDISSQRPRRKHSDPYRIDTNWTGNAGVHSTCRPRASNKFDRRWHSDISATLEGIFDRKLCCQAAPKVFRPFRVRREECQRSRRETSTKSRKNQWNKRSCVQILSDCSIAARNFVAGLQKGHWQLLKKQKIRHAYLNI